MTGEDHGERSEPEAQPPSPFHVITIPDSTHHCEYTPGVDSPRAAAPKIKKATTTSRSTGMVNDCAPPARRGRRTKNCGKKKTSETVTSSKLETDGSAGGVSVTVDGKVFNTTSKFSSGDVQRVSGKDGVESGMVDGSVDGNGKSRGTAAEDTVSGKTHVDRKTHHDDGKTRHAEATSDVEQKPPARDTVKGRRCTSVPAGNSRYSVTTEMVLENIFCTF